MNTLVANPTQVNKNELETRVKSMYRKVALNPEVEYHFEMGRALAERLGYPYATLDQIPAEAIDSFAGVGYYFDLAKLQEGEFVVDLGSGSGMDVFYAALQVGEKGEVIGIDMTDEQLKKSTLLRDKANFEHVYFHNSYIEQLPIVSESIDVVISNGVINLSSSKTKVFREAARVLKPGGRLVLSDIVTSSKLPENISCNATLWAACIGGAMQIDEYFELIEAAGLEITEVKENPYEFISKSAQGATKDYGIKSISISAVKSSFNPII
jgi:arsenite methyltransferase